MSVSWKTARTDQEVNVSPWTAGPRISSQTARGQPWAGLQPGSASGALLVPRRVLSGQRSPPGNKTGRGRMDRCLSGQTWSATVCESKAARQGRALGSTPNPEEEKATLLPRARRGGAQAEVFMLVMQIGAVTSHSVFQNKPESAFNVRRSPAALGCQQRERPQLRRGGGNRQLLKYSTNSD